MASAVVTVLPANASGLVPLSIIKNEVTLKSAVDVEDSSLLQIMKIPQLKLSMYYQPYEVMFWDTGSTNH